jgi:hypothetical protein
VWQITATLLRYKIEADSDVHLVLSDSGGRTMIAEISPCLGDAQSHGVWGVRNTPRDDEPGCELHSVNYLLHWPSSRVVQWLGPKGRR